MIATKVILNNIMKLHGLANIKITLDSMRGEEYTYRENNKMVKGMYIFSQGPLTISSYDSKRTELFNTLDAKFKNAGLIRSEDAYSDEFPIYCTPPGAKKPFQLALHTYITPEYSHKCNLDKAYKKVSIVPLYS